MWITCGRTTNFHLQLRPCLKDQVVLIMSGGEGSVYVALMVGGAINSFTLSGLLQKQIVPTRNRNQFQAAR